MLNTHWDTQCPPCCSSSEHFALPIWIYGKCRAPPNIGACSTSIVTALFVLCTHLITSLLPKGRPKGSQQCILLQGLGGNTHPNHTPYPKLNLVADNAMLDTHCIILVGIILPGFVGEVLVLQALIPHTGKPMDHAQQIGASLGALLLPRCPRHCFRAPPSAVANICACVRVRARVRVW